MAGSARRSLSIRKSLHHLLASGAVALGMAAIGLPSSHAATALADQPVFSNISVPGNLALALSVE